MAMLLAFPGRVWAQQLLTKACEVIELGNAAAMQAKPAAKVSGVVTFAVARGAVTWIYVQDDSAGVLVMPRDPAFQPKPGTMVEASGVVDGGLFAPRITDAVLRETGRGNLPMPLRREAARLAAGDAFGQWVEVDGVVRDAMRMKGQTTLLVSAGATHFRVVLAQAEDAVGIERWRDATLRFQGLNWTDNEVAEGKPGSFRLFVPDPAHVIRQADKEKREVLAGTMTARRPDGTLLLRLADGGAIVAPRALLPRSEDQAVYLTQVECPPLHPGDEVVIDAVRAEGGGTPLYHDGRWSGRKSAAPQAAVKVPLAQVAAGFHDGRLVETEGELLGRERRRAGWFEEELLTLSVEGTVFEAIIPAGMKGTAFPATPKHRYRITGVALRTPGGDGSNMRVRIFPANDGALADLGAVTSAWSRSGWKWATGLGLATLGPLAWIVVLRRRIALQKKEAAAHAEVEAAIRASESKFRLLFERSSDPMLLLDGRALQFIDCNDAALDLMQCTKEQFRGLPPWEISPERQPDGQLSLDSAAHQIHSLAHSGTRRFEWVHQRMDGSTFPVEVMLTSIELGSQPLIFVIWREISERKKMEAALLELNAGLERRVEERTAELKSANEKLQRSEEELHRNLAREMELNELKSAFVSMVSHEFRTPLGIIMSSSEILGRYFGRMSEGDRTEHLASIARNSRRMAGMMEEVLLLSRLDAGRMECKPAPLALPGFCRRLVDEMHSATHRACTIEFSGGEGLEGETMADENLLRHILGNLLSNAVKYSVAGEPVSLDLRRVGHEIVFKVADRGIGIPDADRGRLFEAFHRGRNVGQRPGTGLGLVIVKRCTELHGGRLQLTSEEGGGSTFVISIATPPATP